MGSNEQSDPIDGTVLVSEAPKEAGDRSSEECGSLVPLVSVSSTIAEIDSNVFSSPIHKTTSALEALKEEEESFCADECGSLVLEHPALMSGSGLIDQCKETVDESVYEQQFCMETSESLGCDGDFISFMDGSPRTFHDSVVDMCCEPEIECKDVAAVLAAVESNTKDNCCPESNKLSEVECGISSISLNKINLKNERMLHYLNPVASSLEYVHFPGYDCASSILGESQMTSLKQSVLSGSGIVEEGSLPSLHSDNLSVQRNLKSVMDLSDAVNGLLVDIPLSLRNGVPNSSTKWHERKNSDHIDVQLPGINSESSDLEHEVLSGQHVSSFVTERSTMQSPVKQLDSLQSCVPDMVLGSGSSIDPSRQEAFKLNGIIEGNNCIIEGNNSLAVADASCFADEGQGDTHTRDQLKESNEASLRRSSRANKFIHKASNRNNTSKGSSKASSRTIDLLPAAVRSRRSCLNRSARVSNWGLIDTLSNYIELNTRVDQGSRSVKSGKKNKKKDKIHEGAGSRGSYAKNCVSSGHIRLKLKLVNKSKSIIVPNPLVGTDTQVAHFRNGNKQPDLSNGEGSQKSLECSSSIMMNKSATSFENPGVAVHSVHTDLGVTLMSDKCSRNDIGGRSSSDKEVEKSGVSTDDRHLNSGTSPDSEVIQVPDSQLSSEVLEVHLDGEMDSSKAISTSAQNAIPRRKKGNKKEKLCQLVNSDVQNSLLSSSIIYKTEMVGKFCDNGPKSDVATRFDGGHELSDSRNSKKLLPPAKAEGNRKSKSKLKPNGTPRLEMNKSRGVKGDKWKLEGKYSVCENGISNQAHQKDDSPEVAGKHAMDDSGNVTHNTTSGGTTNDASGLSVIPGGIVQQIAQPRSAWVCCDDCLKWRCIPSNLADIIDDTNCRWTCKDNQDKAFAECSIPQEKSNAEINAELNISDAEEGHDVQSGGPQQSSWMLIKSNIYLHRSRKTQTVDEIMVCHCKSTRDGKLGCGDECLNRMLNIECVHGTCPCGDLCANQQFQRQSYANLKWFRCGKKGYGLQVIDDVTQGQFLIEYVGEVLELPTYEERVRMYASKGHKHFYFMTLNGNEVIDACAKGNLGRFINHSCDPNCRTEKWMVNGEICIGIFAIRDIKKGEELTFDYNYVRVFGAAAKKCHCGSAQCRGYIGGDRLNNEAIVQGDSDEEFPEPVAVYENGEIAEEYNIMSKSDSANVLEEKNEDNLLQKDTAVTLEDKDVMNKLEFSQKDGMHESVVGYSQTNSSVEVMGYMQAENVDKTTLDVEQEKPMSRINISSVSPKRSDSLSLNRLHPESLLESVDTRSSRSLIEMGGGEAVASKARPRMKKSRPSKPFKSKESSDSSATIDKPLVTSSKSQVTPNKLKKLVENSAKHRLETVEDKLNELLDNVGGICKRKDAFKGYLKLLVLTAASGDCSHHETIQSNKDLSMILDAILKTKSRTVLTDILNKNGLQMLHSLMKKCRGNFTKIPILRKLLKVFECLAERKILTLEHINAEPPRPGMERFRDSILTLTEYEDRKVHQIARNFRDRWIPRPSKKFNSLEKGDRIMDFSGAPNCSRLLGSHHQRFDQVERDSESMDCVKQSLPSNHLIDSDALEGSPRLSVRRIRKRKSGWDQLPDAVSPHCIKEQKIEAGSSLMFDSDLHPWKREEMTFDDHLKTSSQELRFCNEDDERRVTDEDAPPGFSLPSFGSPHLSTGTSTTGISFSQQYPGPLKCPPEMPLGYPQEIYNSDMPMAYAIPFNTVQEFGTPAASTGDSWVIAPGMPFRPFPPLPPYPHQRSKNEVPPPAFSGVGSAGKSQDCYLTDTHMDQGCPSSSSAGLPNMIPNGNTHSQQERGPYRHERRYFKQRQKNFRQPPWGLDGKGNGCRRNYSTTPAGVALGTMVSDHSEHPENVNYGVEFAGNSSC